MSKKGRTAESGAAVKCRDYERKRHVSVGAVLKQASGAAKMCLMSLAANGVIVIIIYN